MKLTKEQVLTVVHRGRQKMSADSKLTSIMVGGFVQSQQPTSHFIQEHEAGARGAEGSPPPPPPLPLPCR